MKDEEVLSNIFPLNIEQLRKTLIMSLITGVAIAGIGCTRTQEKNVLSSSTKKPQKKEIVGGPCSYSHYPGKATITRVEKTEESKRQARTSGEPGYEGYKVWFIFKANQPIKEEWVRKSIKRERLFRLTNSWYPGPRYLKKYDIKVGSEYRCTLKVITSGTCTPIILEFSQLKQDDYFEKAGEQERRKNENEYEEGMVGRNPLPHFSPFGYRKCSGR